jgi:Na+-transporting NADH:ubiquinone oxidoreductase subunit F
MLYDMRNTGNKRKAVYYFGANEPRELLLVDLMREFEKELADFRFVPVVFEPGDSDAAGYEKGLVTDAVERDLKNGEECEAYLCGSPGMIDAAIKVLRGLGVESDKIFYDKFA